MRLLIALAVVGCSAAHTLPAAPVAPVAMVAPPDNDELAPQLLIAGNRALSTARLRTDLTKAVCDAQHQIELVIATATKGKEAPACGTPEDYRIGIEVLYLAEGYVDAKAAVVTRHGEPTTIVIEEGPRYRLGSIVMIDKIGALAATAVSRTTDLAPGEPFNRDRIHAAITALADRYDSAGFGLANVLPLTKVDKQTHRIDLTLEVERGPVARVVAIDVLGDRADRVSRTGRELANLAPGTTFSSRAMRDAEERLRDTGKFTRVGLSVDWVGASGGDQVKVIVFAD